VFLTDFGSGIYPGADTLTPQQLPPGTPAYRSPEAWLFTLQFRHTSERYRAGPADDVFALGVTACVLATGGYPDMGEPRKDEQGLWHMDSLLLPRALFSAQVAPPLRELILRMLSIRPEQRGTAAQLAQALERAADSLSASCSPSSTSVPEPPAVRSAQVPASPRALPPRALASSWRWLGLAAAAGALAMWALWMTWNAFTGAPAGTRLPSPVEHPTGSRGSPYTEPVGLGEAAASTAAPAPATPPTSEKMTADSPPDPYEGQAQPDKKGRCARSEQVVLNKHCWGRLELSREKCEAINGQLYQGMCYVPLFPPGFKRPNTSSPGTPR
jgi:serine/threonine protein kinase